VSFISATSSAVASFSFESTLSGGINCWGCSPSWGIFLPSWLLFFW
jgi:hypothetical protein